MSYLTAILSFLGAIFTGANIKIFGRVRMFKLSLKYAYKSLIILLIFLIIMVAMCKRTPSTIHKVVETESVK